MRDLSTLAAQIRAVRQAQRRFVGHWRLERVMIGPEVLDHLADEMAAAHRELDEYGDALNERPSQKQTPRHDEWGYTRGRLWSM